MLKRTLLLFTVITGLASCDGYTENEFYVNNRTNERIIMQVDVFQESITDSVIVIPSGGSSLVRWTSQLGGNPTPELPIPEWADSDTSVVRVVTMNGDTLIKDIRDSNNWSIFSKQRHKVPSNWFHEHWFYILPEDIE